MNTDSGEDFADVTRSISIPGWSRNTTEITLEELQRFFTDILEDRRRSHPRHIILNRQIQEAINTKIKEIDPSIHVEYEGYEWS